MKRQKGASRKQFPTATHRVIAEFDLSWLSSPENVWICREGKRHAVNMPGTRRRAFLDTPFCVRCGMKAERLIMVAVHSGKDMRIDAVDRWGTKLSIDHIEPRSKGGKTVEDNLQTMCQPCNTEKGSKSLRAFYQADQYAAFEWARPPAEV